MANQAGLQDLGARIDKAGSGRGRRRWSRKRKVVTALSVFFVLVLVTIGAGFGFLEYEFHQITTAPCPACTQVTSGAPYNVLVIGSDSRQGLTRKQERQLATGHDIGGHVHVVGSRWRAEHPV